MTKKKVTLEKLEETLRTLLKNATDLQIKIWVAIRVIEDSDLWHPYGSSFAAYLKGRHDLRTIDVTNYEKYVSVNQVIGASAVAIVGPGSILAMAEVSHRQDDTAHCLNALLPDVKTRIAIFRTEHKHPPSYSHQRRIVNEIAAEHGYNGKLSKGVSWKQRGELLAKVMEAIAMASSEPNISRLAAKALIDAGFDAPSILGETRVTTTVSASAAAAASSGATIQ